MGWSVDSAIRVDGRFRGLFPWERRALSPAEGDRGFPGRLKHVPPFGQLHAGLDTGEQPVSHLLPQPQSRGAASGPAPADVAPLSLCSPRSSFFWLCPGAAAVLQPPWFCGAGAPCW